MTSRGFLVVLAMLAGVFVVPSAECKTVYWFCFSDENGTKNAYFTGLFVGDSGYDYQEKVGVAWRNYMNQTTHGFSGGGCYFGPGTSSEGSQKEAAMQLAYDVSREQRYGKAVVASSWTYSGN